MQYVVIAAIGAAVSYYTSRAMAQTQKISQEGARVDDLNVVGSKYNEGVPLAYGANRLPANIVWSRPLKEVVVVNKQKTGGGGKGGGGGGGGTTITTTNYYYYGTFGAILCHGEQNRPLRIWFDKNLVWQSPAGQRVLSGNLNGGGSFEFLTGSNTASISTIAQNYLGVGNTPGYRNSCCIFFSSIPVEKYGNRIPAVEVETVEVGPGVGTTAAKVIRALCAEVGINLTYVDTSEVDRDLVGMKVTPGQAATFIEDILSVLHLQVCFSDDRLKFKPIDQPTVAEIPEDDLMLSEDSLFPITRIREDDLPQEVSIEYIDQANDYQANNQKVNRFTTSSSQTIKVSANMAMSANDAAKCADILMNRAWSARMRFGSFTLSRQYMYLEPGDVVGITFQGKRYLVRITQIDIGVDFSMKVEGESYDSVILESELTGDSGEGFPGQGLPNYGTTYFYFVDLPALTSTEADQTGFYFAATGDGIDWRSASLEVSSDGGLNWSFAAILPAYCTMGEAITVLPPPPNDKLWHRWDRTSTVDIKLFKGELASTTEEQIWAGQNAFIIGKEVIQAMTVTPLGNNTYRLSDLLRGRRETQDQMTNHAIYEDAVFASGMIFVPIDVDSRGVDLLYRITPTGSNTVSEYRFRSDGLTAYPFKPVHIKGVRFSGSVYIEWHGVSRKSTELPNNGIQPPEYDPLRFSVQIFNDDWTEVVREFTVENVTEATYTREQQMIDWGGQKEEIRVRIAQWSPHIGYGFSADEILNIPATEDEPEIFEFQIPTGADVYYMTGGDANWNDILKCVYAEKKSWVVIPASSIREWEFINDTEYNIIVQVPAQDDGPEIIAGTSVIIKCDGIKISVIG